MPPQRSSRQAGFSIIDVMMAAVILVVGFMGLIQAITIGSEMLASAQRQNLATQIINQQIERYRLYPWNDSTAVTDIYHLPAGPTSLVIPTLFTNALGASGGTAAWTLTRSVTTLTTDSFGAPTLRAITFTVTWTKSGTSSSGSTPTGSALDVLAFSRYAPISRTYTRIGTGFYGASGINLTVQRL